jgi:hypothetical protein
MPFLPDAVLLGQFPLAIIALSGLLGGVVAYWLASYTAKRAGTDVEAAKDIVLNLLIGGVLGAKLLYLVLDPVGHFANPVLLLLFPYGPLTLPAGIVGGLAAVAWSLRHHPDRTGIIDAVAIPLAVGLGIALMGWKEPGSWAVAPSLIAAALVATVTAPKAPTRGGMQAAHTLVLAGLAVVFADLARPVGGLGGGITSLQWGAAITATGAWLWIRRKTPETS